jgi:Replication-relaxation
MTATPVDERMLNAGVGLSAGTIQWGQRPEQPVPVALTIRDLRLMALLHDTNYLSASQLTLLGWGSAERAAQERLKRLHDAGYLDRFRPLAAHGTREWNYRLTQTGWQALAAQDMPADGRHYTPAEITSISYTEHDLQLAAIILHIATTAAAPGPGGLLDRMPFQWQGHRSGRIEPGTLLDRAPGKRQRHHGDRIEPDSAPQLKRSSAASLPEGTRLHPGRSRPGYLEPDATLTGRVGDERFAVLIEYDRTNRPHKQLDRLRRYEHFLLDGWRHTRFATHATPPSVLFLTAREQPLARLIQTADETFTAWHGAQHATAREGTHPARQRTVFTSRQRILEGDWTMQRTPSLPPDTRDPANGSTCVPRPVAYNLPALFATGQA